MFDEEDKNVQVEKEVNNLVNDMESENMKLPILMIFDIRGRKEK